VTVDRAAIAARLRGLLGGQDNSDLEELAARLGVEEMSLRMSVDDLSPHPTVEVLAAVIRVYGVDPSWLLTGQYDAATHRSVMEGEADPATAVRQFFYERKVRISEPTRERFRFNDQN
jgi:transcriptional regulator with XRE-family HTH domain